MPKSESKIELKQATLDDIDGYIALERKVGGRTYSALVSKEEIVAKVGVDNIYLFKLGDKTIGHVNFRANDDKSIHLGGFVIDPEYQGKGFGRQAMELIIKIAAGAPKIDLVTHPDNVKAVGLYKSLGFVIAERKENYWGDGEPRVVMVKISAIKKESLNRKAFEGLFFLIVALAVLLFGPAGTIHYWQAWVFLAVFSVSVLLVTLYLMKKNPQLLARRVNAGSAAETQKSQKIIQFIAQIAFALTIVIPALDHRFGWSTVPVYKVAVGDILVVLGLYFVFLVFKENSYTSAVIEIGAEQKVISTGPYAIVRHRMYAGAFIMLLGVPLALGSWRGLIPVAVLMASIVWRLLEEEKFLAKNLAGYPDYQKKVKYRLLPFIW